MERRWDFQARVHRWPLQLGFHIDHADPSITLHLPCLIVAVGRLKQPGFRVAHPDHTLRLEVAYGRPDIAFDCHHAPGAYPQIDPETGGHVSDDCWAREYWDAVDVDDICFDGEWPNPVPSPCPVRPVWWDGLVLEFDGDDRVESRLDDVFGPPPASRGHSAPVAQHTGDLVDLMRTAIMLTFVGIVTAALILGMIMY